MTDEDLLTRTYELAEAAVRDGVGGPFGAVIVCDGEILAEGENRVLATGDPTQHAEVVAIRRAVERLTRSTVLEQVPRPAGSDDPAPVRARMLLGATIYTSCHPCPMCLSAIYWARIDRVVHGASALDAAAIGFDDAAQYADLCRPPDERRLRIEQLDTPSRLAPFELWRSDPQRPRY